MTSNFSSEFFTLILQEFSCFIERLHIIQECNHHEVPDLCGISIGFLHQIIPSGLIIKINIADIRINNFNSLIKLQTTKLSFLSLRIWICEIEILTTISDFHSSIIHYRASHNSLLLTSNLRLSSTIFTITSRNSTSRRNLRFFIFIPSLIQLINFLTTNSQLRFFIQTISLTKILRVDFMIIDVFELIILSHSLKDSRLKLFN